MSRLVVASPFDGLRPEAPPLPILDSLFSLLVPVTIVLTVAALALLALSLVRRIPAQVRTWLIRTAALMFVVAVVLGVVLVVLAL